MERIVFPSMLVLLFSSLSFVWNRNKANKVIKKAKNEVEMARILQKAIGIETEYVKLLITGVLNESAYIRMYLSQSVLLCSSIISEIAKKNDAQKLKLVPIRFTKDEWFKKLLEEFCNSTDEIREMVLSIAICLNDVYKIKHPVKDVIVRARRGVCIIRVRLTIIVQALHKKPDDCEPKIQAEKIEFRLTEAIA